MCLARALVREPRILILDEATSALDVATRDRLFTVIRRLREQGCGIMFISHRMDEVEEIADRVTVMRSGESVATLDRADVNTRRLVELMTGVKDAGEEMRPTVEVGERVRDHVLVRATGVRLHDRAAAIDFEIKAGELVGVAGLEGHGQDRFLRVLAGAPAVDGEVVCMTEGKPRALRNPSDALASGIAYVPKDRRTEGIFATRSILENFQVSTLPTDRKYGLVRRYLTERRFDRYAEMMNIKTGHRGNVITSLSGGNSAEGGDRALARDHAEGPAAERPDARRRHRHQGRHLPGLDRRRGGRGGGRDALHRADRARRADGPGAGLPRGRAVPELAREALTRPRLVASYFGREH